MFNWFSSIFMIASLVILFITWMRAIRVKEMIGEGLQKDWSLVRVLVFVAFVSELILLIFSLIGMRATFAYLSGIYLIYFSIVLYYVVSFFLTALGEKERPAITAPPASSAEEQP